MSSFFLLALSYAVELLLRDPPYKGHCTFYLLFMQLMSEATETCSEDTKIVSNLYMIKPMCLFDLLAYFPGKINIIAIRFYLFFYYLFINALQHKC